MNCKRVCFKLNFPDASTEEGKFDLIRMENR